MKLNSVLINIVFCSKPISFTLEQRLNLFQIKEWANLYYTNDYSIGNFKTIARVKLINSNLIDYYSSEFNSSLNNSWGVTKNTFIYKQDSTEIKFSKYELIFDDLKGKIFQAKIKAQNTNISTSDLFNLFFQELEQSEKERLSKILNNKKVSLIYSDNFLRNPFASILLIQFINSIRDKFSLEIDNLEILVKPIEYNYQQQTYYIKDQFQDDEMRRDFISSICADIEIPNTSIISSDQLPHWRSLSILVDDIEVVSISPDAGVEHGWFANNKYIKRADVDINENLQMTQVLNKEILYTIKFEK